MRKLFFLLLLIPFLASIGHDVYIYTEEPEKGFRLSDIGALWDKYHKESHDQWKSRVHEFSDELNEVIPPITLPKSITSKIAGNNTQAENQNDAQTTQNETEQPDYTKGFKQTIERDGSTKTSIITNADVEKNRAEQKPGKIIKWIGFLLEQKAVIVAAIIPAAAFILNFIFSALFGKKEDGAQKKIFTKKKKKGGGYQYSRK